MEDNGTGLVGLSPASIGGRTVYLPSKQDLLSFVSQCGPVDQVQVCATSNMHTHTHTHPHTHSPTHHTHTCLNLKLFKKILLMLMLRTPIKYL